ncbi:hypothetical protein CLF_101459 [Clonorchis sinensis]|uniref:Uncharacterized protein n=1 Tax=Clonorchis sinensis TaxID=79923 RepID=G7Y5T1_CLOSI|nr:hypothetical protein CLF_101459 [Clonorchis sinensis]
MDWVAAKEALAAEFDMLGSRWQGPFVVTDRRGKVYTIQDGRGSKRVNGTQLLKRSGVLASIILSYWDLNISSAFNYVEGSSQAPPEAKQLVSFDLQRHRSFLTDFTKRCDMSGPVQAIRSIYDTFDFVAFIKDMSAIFRCSIAVHKRLAFREHFYRRPN